MKSVYVQDARQLQQLVHALQEHMWLYGFEPVSIPVIEPSHLFLTRASDRIVNQLFTFERYGRQLALRPEFTAAAAYHYVQQKYTHAVRWQFNGPVFVDDPQDHSLNFQSPSVGAEYIGESGVIADAELITMTVQAIQNLDLPDWQLVLGNVGLQLHLLGRFGLDSRSNRLLLAQRDTLKDSTKGIHHAIQNIESILSYDRTPSPSSQNNDDATHTQQMLDVLLDSTKYGITMGGRSRTDIARRLLSKQEYVSRKETVLAALNFLDQWVNMMDTPAVAFDKIERWIPDEDAIGLEMLSQWRETVNLLLVAGIEADRIRIQPDLTKNWEYYTGLVFGVRVPDDRYVAGGGRYDTLATLLGSPHSVPAIGVAFYVDELLGLFDNKTEADVFVNLDTSNLSSTDTIWWLTALRAHGIPVRPNDVGSQVTIGSTQKSLMFENSHYQKDSIQQLVQDVRAKLP